MKEMDCLEIIVEKGKRCKKSAKDFLQRFCYICNPPVLGVAGQQDAYTRIGQRCTYLSRSPHHNDSQYFSERNRFF